MAVEIVCGNEFSENHPSCPPVHRQVVRPCGRILVNPVAIRGIFYDEDKKRNGASTLQRVLARMQMGTKELQLHSPVCAGCEQFALRGRFLIVD